MSDDLLDRLDVLARSSSIYAGSGQAVSSEILERLCSYISCSADSVGVLRFLALCLRAGPARRECRINLDPSRFEDPSDELAAWIALLGSLSVSASDYEAEIEAAVVAATLQDGEELFDGIDAIVRFFPREDLGPALVRLSRCLRDSEHLSILYRALQENVAQRRSRFSVASSWPQFGLAETPLLVIAES